MRKFHTYLYGHPFTLVTDNKPLQCILFAMSSCKALTSSDSLTSLVLARETWQCIHVDSVDHFQGTMFLVTVDAHSKWPEVSMMSSTTVSKIMDVLRQMFAAYGLPDQIVSDNGLNYF